MVHPVEDEVHPPLPGARAEVVEDVAVECVLGEGPEEEAAQEEAESGEDSDAVAGRVDASVGEHGEPEEERPNRADA